MSRPEDLGVAYERTLDAGTRRRLGAFYTPPSLATALARETLRGLPPTARVCDPAVGGGALLLAAARELLDRGADPRSLATTQLAGRDIDPGAVDVARRSLSELLGYPARLISHGDSLRADAWADAFDAVVTNPPFLNQLQSTTARTRPDARAAAARWGVAGQGYVDTSALFLLLSLSLVGTVGRVGIILPEPLFSTRDAAAARIEVGRRTRLEWISRPGLGAFDAGVRVVLCTLAVVDAGHNGDGGGDRTAGRDRDDAWVRGDWRGAIPTDTPDLPLASDGIVDDIAAVTADFRDQYYGVVAAVTDDGHTDGGVPLVTSGTIDPARVWWGRRPARIGGTRRDAPVAELTRLTPELARWADRRLVPKVMVATQTRVIEAAADPDGTYLPVVPVITAATHPGRIWHLLAALLAPPISAHAHRAHGGAALSADALKLSARQVAALPLPADTDAWTRGAQLAQRATKTSDDAWPSLLRELGEMMCEAYACDVMDWWWPRVERIVRRAG